MNSAKASTAVLLSREERVRHTNALVTMPSAFVNHYRCPMDIADFNHVAESSTAAGYFRCGKAICYGRMPRDLLAAEPLGALHDVANQVEFYRNGLVLPFDLSEVVTNLRYERYPQVPASHLQRLAGSHVARNLYHFIRPMLSIAVRKHFQRVGSSGWNRVGFPRWPVDVTVETLFEEVMTMALKHSGLSRVPFIWFWPEGASSSAMMTHDVETRVGHGFCDQLMDLDQEYGIRAAFQIVPEGRYDVSDAFLSSFRQRGFEINVHDLVHDGRLFQNRSEFLSRAHEINRYAAKFGSRGFRAGVMDRNQEWLDALDVSYDMSVPNVAHLEPQHGGCCTVMPFFIGEILELPLTTVQDYSLFHILRDYSIDLWKAQAETIRSKHGLISFITHPDYLVERRARKVYEQLLAYIVSLRDERNVWLALPGEIDQWWRERNQMTLVRNASGWRIVGPGSHRARLAYATLEGDRVVYEIDQVKVH